MSEHSPSNQPCVHPWCWIVFSEDGNPACTACKTNLLGPSLLPAGHKHGCAVSSYLRGVERVACDCGGASNEPPAPPSKEQCREQFDMWAENLGLCMDEIFMSSAGVPENPFEDQDTKSFYMAWLAAWEARDALGSAPPPRADLIADAIREIDAFCDRTDTAWPTLTALRVRLADAYPPPRPAQPPTVVQNMEKIAWCQKVHEDLALYIDDGSGQMIHVRAKRALGIMFEEMQKIEKALYPSLTKSERCSECREPLPPLATWSMPACPACVGKADAAQAADECMAKVRQHCDWRCKCGWINSGSKANCGSCEAARPTTEKGERHE